MANKTKKTLLWMSIISLLLLSAVAVTYRSTSVVVERIIADHQLVRVNNRVDATEIWLDQQMRILDAAADSIPYPQLGNNQATLDPLRMAMRAGHFSDVYIGMTDGSIIDGAGWEPPFDYDTRVRPWYREAVNAGKTSFTTPYIDMVTREFVIALVTPLYHQGQFVGVMSADTILDSLVKTLLATKIGETGYLFVALKDGTILIHPNQNYVMKASLQEIEPTLSNIGGTFSLQREGTIHYQGEGQDNLLAYKQISNTDWYLCTTIPVKEAYGQLRKTTLLFAAEILLKVLGGLAILTLLGVGGSGVLLFVSSKRYQSAIQDHVDQISGISADLSWNIRKRREVETRYKTLFNVANDAILISKEMTIIECNDKASDLFGGDRYSLIGRNELDLFPDIQPDGGSSEETARTILDQAIAGRQQYYEWTFRRLDGSEFPAEVSLKTLRLNKEELVLTSIRDISKRVFAERQLLQNQKMAAMGEMLGAIAHQWRQPLNILSTYIASLQAAYINRAIDKPFVETLVKNTNIQVQFMSKTIDDFRNFFKPSKSKQPFDVLKALNHAIKLVAPRLKQSEFNISVRVDADAAEFVTNGYQSEFVHVMMNLVSNAKDAIEECLRAMDDPHPGEIVIEVLTVADDIVLHVKDNGCGIADHHLAHIFSPYFTTKGTQSGTGIGLYMAKMMIEQEMNGHISATSSEYGTIMTVRLPQYYPPEVTHA